MYVVDICYVSLLHVFSTQEVGYPSTYLGKYVGHVIKLTRLTHTDLKTQDLDLMPTRYLF